MPLYEYQCIDCRDEFEELVRSAASASEVKCPRCGGEHVRRKVSLFASTMSMGSFGASAAPASSCAPSGG